MTTNLMRTKTRYVPVLAGALVGLALATLVSVLLYYVEAKARLEAEGRARTVLAEARDQVDRRLETALAVPETLAAVIAARESIDHATFDAVAARLVRANPSIRNVALAPDGVITAVHPLRGNERALGLRYADVPEQNSGVLEAIATRRTVIAGPVQLVQGGTGLLSRTPVFLRDAEGHDSRYWGIVALAVDTDQLFTDIAHIADSTGFDIAVRRSDPGAAPGKVFAGDADVFADEPVSTYYPLPGGGRWELGALPAAGWSAASAAPQPARVLLYVLAALLGWGAYRVVASRDRNQLLAHRDPLTGLSNRASFERRLQLMLHAKPRSCALVLIDLDGFKPINDTLGHRAGDQVLQAVAGRLTHLSRGGDDVYRLGGDEFAFLLQDVRADHDMLRFAERAIARIAEPIPLDGGRAVAAAASAGIALFPMVGYAERTTDVFDRADRALYGSKAQGGNRVQAEPPIEHWPPVA
jgi:diguanylate cyclase